MASEQGFAAYFWGDWAAARWRAFNGLRRRLAIDGIRTVERRLGPRKGWRWVIDSCPLDPVEITAWQMGGQERIPEMQVEGLTTAAQARVFLLAAATNINLWPGVVLDPDTAARLEPALRVIAAVDQPLVTATAWSLTRTPQVWLHLADLADAAPLGVIAALAPDWEGTLEDLLSTAAACAPRGRPVAGA